MGAILSRTQEPQGEELQDHPVNETPRAADSRLSEMDSQESEEAEAEVRRLGHEHEMESLKADLAAKRAQRREALDALRQELTREREERLRLEALIQEEGGSRAEVEGLERQVKALKDVAQIGGEMLRIRELQVNELKEKLRSIEETGVAYEKEVENMRQLKNLYEERSRATAISHQMELEREKTKLQVAEKKQEIAEEKNRELTEVNKELNERIASLDSTIDKNSIEISELKVQVAGYREELYNANSQITIVNNLFSQLLTDSENVDRVTRVLEEHHDLVNHLTEKGNINDVASVLMTVADRDRVLTDEEQDIASNLNKVWRLLVELLGYHNKQAPGETMPDSCYKSVDTPTGPKLVISVSQTFLRLKDLILEKNSLVKEVGRLKDLNTHLEARLIAQETRLVEVAEELHKTWGVVNKLKSQHKAIHTHEQVLRYELKHKRLMLNELKQQLEECREMWQMARVKNNQTEKDWEELRKEFADRKQQISSAESGYEESPGDSQDEEDSRKLSDDESDMQDLLPSNLPSCVGLSRLQDSEISTPDRSFTPDMQVLDIPPEETAENPECTKAKEPSTIINQEGATSEESTGIDIPGENRSHRLTDQICNIDQTQMPESDSSHVNPFSELPPVSLENLTIEIEPTVQLLPWDTPEETSQEALQFPSSAVIVEEVQQLVFETAEELLTTYNQAVVALISPISELNVTHKATSEPSVIVCNPSLPLTSEQILARREARLRRLEEQCKYLYHKVSNTNKRGDMITSKLVELHEQYGDSRGESVATQSSQSEKELSPPNSIPVSESSGNSNELSKINETEEEPEEQFSDITDGRASR